MVAIPSAEAARAAWDALPEDVRASVIQRAAKGRGHPDPVVAAIAVGRARAEVWPWWRTAMLGIGLCLFVGAWLAFLMVGLDNWPVLIGPAAVGFLLYDGAPRLRTGAKLPRRTESANLQAFLAAPDAETSLPIAPRPTVTRRRVAVAAVEVVGVAAVAIISVEMSATQGGIFADTGRYGVGILIGAAVVVAHFVFQFRRRPIRVSAAEDGLRFNWPHKPVPWSEVTSVAVQAQNVVWSLRNGKSGELPLAVIGRQPENLCLTAWAYMEAARQAA